MLAALWGPVIYLLGAQWTFFGQYNYGWAVPVLCIYLAWERWQTGKRRAQSAEPGAVEPGNIERSTFNIQHSTSNVQKVGERKADLNSQLSTLNFGSPTVWLLFVGGVLLWATRILQEANPVWRAASYGLAMEAVAVTLLLLYLTGGASRVKQFAFPIVFFLVAVPWPTPVESAVIQNLTRLNSAAVVELLNGFGVPALARGNVIEVSTGMVGIDEACSGIRSVQATLMVSLFFGEFYRLRVAPRLMMVVGGLVSAMLFNLARMFLLTWVASRDGTQAIEKWHDPAGVTILVACFLFLWGLGVWLGKRRAGGRGRRTEDGPVKLAEDFTGQESQKSVVSGQWSVVSGQWSEVRPPNSQFPAPSSNFQAPIFHLQFLLQRLQLSTLNLQPRTRRKAEVSSRKPAVRPLSFDPRLPISGIWLALSRCGW
ncbi:MAG: exosortase/archaeosortase family protein [Verrucomicrobia bacterium]|nr:exosortase/archaeosortase family protein [Verrucomicrobiota bacterium]